jgi:hypothetical protein
MPWLYAGTLPGRPVRSNRGTGGQRAQLEKASAIVGEGLLNKVTGQKRDRNYLIGPGIPEDLPENILAPPVQTKRARVYKAVIIFYILSFFLVSYKVYLIEISSNRFLRKYPEFPTKQNDPCNLHPSPP